MGRISDDTIAEIRETISLREVVEEAVALKRTGATYSGLCPFHDERTPSFHVTEATRTWRCYGCGAHGDIIDFVQQNMGGGWREAVIYLAERARIPLKELDDGDIDTAERARRENARLHDACEAAADWFAMQLLTADEAPTARAELERRHFDPYTAAEKFDCGYAPRSATAMIGHLTGLGFTPHDLLTAGLVTEIPGRGVRPRFRGRLTWALRSGFGKVTGFGARRLYDDDPIPAKFINTADTPVFNKSATLYAFHHARKQIARARHVYVVEGYTDVMAAHLAGHTNTVATCGTAFTDKHLTALRAIVGEHGEITFALDDDNAGRTASMKIYDLAHTRVRRLTALLPSEGLDPDDYRRVHGDAALHALMESRQALLQTVITNTLAGLPVDTVEDRISALDKVAPLLAHATDPLIRREYTAHVAQTLDLRVDDIDARIPDLPPDDAPPPPPPPTFNPERELVGCILLHPDTTADLIPAARAAVDSPKSEAVLDACERARTAPGPDLWLTKVTAALDPDLHPVLDKALATPPTIGAERAAAYARSLIDRLTETATTRQQATLLEQLAAATDPADRARILADLTRLGR